MKKLLLLLLIVAGFSTASIAQSYKSAVGLRLGTPVSVSYKTFLNESSAVEVYAGVRTYSFYNQFNVNAAYLIHNEFPDVENLTWYYGAGAGLVFYSFDTGFGGDDSGMSILLSGYLGLEYTLANTPVSFTADWVPGMFIGGYGSGFGAGYGALGVRYILNRGSSN